MWTRMNPYRVCAPQKRVRITHWQCKKTPAAISELITKKRVAPQSALIPCVFFCPLCQGKIYYFCPTTDEQSVQNTWTGIALSPSYKCHVVKFFNDKHTDNLKWIRSRIWRTYFSDGQLMPPWYGCCPRWGDFLCKFHPPIIRIECINYQRNHYVLNGLSLKIFLCKYTLRQERLAFHHFLLDFWLKFLSPKLRKRFLNLNLR